MKRQTILGPYEYINGYWCSSRVTEGEVRKIEDKFYFAEDDILYGIVDIVQHTKDKYVSKWIEINFDST